MLRTEITFKSTAQKFVLQKNGAKAYLTGIKRLFPDLLKETAKFKIYEQYGKISCNNSFKNTLSIIFRNSENSFLEKI